jgi:tRNA(fMet)-specific endonuclease VapC
VSGIVADTSEWIEYLAGRPADLLDHALASGLVVVPPIVIAELLSGAVSRQDHMGLEDLLRDLVVHDTAFDHWSRVGELRRTLAQKGLTVSTADAHVAQCALDRDTVLLSRDAVFKRMAEFTRLRLVLLAT